MVAFKLGARFRTLVCCRELMKPSEEGFVGNFRLVSCEILEVSAQVMRKLSYREHLDAWLAAVDVPACDMNSFVACLGAVVEPPLLVMVERVEKPGNIGAMLRSADAAGAHGMILADARTDPGNANVVRASKSAVFSLPVWVSCWDVDLRGSVVVAVGEEKQGLIFHSDRGVQCCSAEICTVLKKACPTVRQSMSRKGNCWDNACAESFFKTLKRELVEQNGRSTRRQTQLAVLNILRPITIAFENIQLWGIGPQSQSANLLLNR